MLYMDDTQGRNHHSVGIKLVIFFGVITKSVLFDSLQIFLKQTTL